jgi:GDP-L-fucose synthase
MANSSRPAELLYDNVMIHGTVVHNWRLYGVTNVLYLVGSL